MAGDNSGGYTWTKTGNVATARAGAAVVLYNGWLYVYGGEDYDGIINDFWRYEISTGNYEKLNSSGATAYTDMVEIDGTMYIFGGKGSNASSKMNLKYYDTTSSSPSWNNISDRGPTPSARFSHITLAYIDPSTSHRIIFVHGGFTSDSIDADGTLYKLDLDDVDGAGKPMWSKLNFNIVMGDHSATIYSNKIYFFGGYNIGAKKYLNQIYVYDIANNTYTGLTPNTALSERSAMKIIATSQGLYTFGGKNSFGCLNDLCFYSFTENDWTTLDIGPDKRCHYNAIIYSNDFLIFGGYNLSASGLKSFNNELWQHPIN